MKYRGKDIIFHKNMDRWNKEAWDRVEACQSKVKACASRLLGPAQTKIQEGEITKAQMDTLDGHFTKKTRRKEMAQLCH